MQTVLRSTEKIFRPRESIRSNATKSEIMPYYRADLRVGSRFCPKKVEIKKLFGSVRSSRNTNLRLSVRLCGPNLSEALNLHLFGSDSLQDHSESIKQAFREHS